MRALREERDRRLPVQEEVRGRGQLLPSAAADAEDRQQAPQWQQDRRPQLARLREQCGGVVRDGGQSARGTEGFAQTEPDAEQRQEQQWLHENEKQRRADGDEWEWQSEWGPNTNGQWQSHAKPGSQ